MIKELGLESEVQKALPHKPSRDAETDTYILNRIALVVSRLKWCHTEEQREDYHVVLGACAPRREAADDGSTDGDDMTERVAKRYKKNGQPRLRAFEQAIVRRAAFDAEAAKHPLNAKGQQATPTAWAVGGAVLCRTQPRTRAGGAPHA